MEAEVTSVFIPNQTGAANWCEASSEDHDTKLLLGYKTTSGLDQLGWIHVSHYTTEAQS